MKEQTWSHVLTSFEYQDTFHYDVIKKRDTVTGGDIVTNTNNAINVVTGDKKTMGKEHLLCDITIPHCSNNVNNSV